MKKVCISGYFDPLHIGHLEYINKAKELGDYLVVIVNNNNQCTLKKGKFFMDDKDRVEIIKNFKSVDQFFEKHHLNHQVNFSGGHLENESSKLLKELSNNTSSLTAALKAISSQNKLLVKEIKDQKENITFP